MLKKNTEFVITNHARFQMERRNISKKQIARVLSSPEQRITIKHGRKVYQSKVDNEQYLLRVFVDIDRRPPEVVTVYLTSKIEKYWEQ